MSELELSNQAHFETQDGNEEIFKEIVEKYISRIEDIRQEYIDGIDTADQTKISDLIEGDKRKDGETFSQYKMRRKAENMILKHYQNGIRRKYTK